jgi:hypothetical protein
MARPERYFIGPNVRSKLTDVFARMDGISLGSEGGGEIPVRLQDMRRPGGSQIRLCKTSAAFNKGTVATLNIWEDGTPPSETQTSGATVENVVNKYANIASGKFVSVAMHGNGRWYVVAAEC